MNLETVSTLATAVLVIASRVISHFEHKKTERGVADNKETMNKIYITVNSRVDQLVAAAEELGRLKGIEEGKQNK